MKFSVSSLSFSGGKIKFMSDLPKNLGVEIFYEWGSEIYWNGILPEIIEGRSGGFSIHGPMMFDDFSQPCDEDILFSHMRAPFELYHRYHGKFYVVHTNGSLSYPFNPIREEEGRKLAIERLEKFHRLCKQEGVNLVVENVGWNRQKRYLFHQKDYFNLFRQIPDLKCLIDVGHAMLSDLSVWEMQKKLGKRITAYHIHDNDGSRDLHLPIGEGIFDWKAFVLGIQAFTPDAELVMEYEGIPQLERYVADSEGLEKINKS